MLHGRRRGIKSGCLRRRRCFGFEDYDSYRLNSTVPFSVEQFLTGLGFDARGTLGVVIQRSKPEEATRTVKTV